MHYILYEGRPEIMDRGAQETAVYDLLDRLGIPYGRVDHPPVMTIQDCEAVEGVLDAAIVKNLFLANAQGTRFILLIMPGHKAFKTKDVSKQLGMGRLSFGKPEPMYELLGVTSGAVSVFGLMNDHEKKVQLVFDGEVLGAEYIGFHPCVNTSSLRVRVEDVLKFIQHTGHEYVLCRL